MLKIENTEVLGWVHAIRGMRNPMNSWEKSDSEFDREPRMICLVPTLEDSFLVLTTLTS